MSQIWINEHVCVALAGGLHVENLNAESIHPKCGTNYFGANRKKTERKRISFSRAFHVPRVKIMAYRMERKKRQVHAHSICANLKLNIRRQKIIESRYGLGAVKTAPTDWLDCNFFFFEKINWWSLFYRCNFYLRQQTVVAFKYRK